MSTRVLASFVALSALLGAAPQTLAAARPAAQRAAFRQLHGLAADLPTIVARLEADLAEGLEVPAEEGAAFLRARAAQALYDFPEMPPGFEAMLSGAAEASASVEHFFRSRAVMLQTYSRLTERPEAWAEVSPALFPRVLRMTIRRSILPGMNHAERFAVLASGLKVLSDLCLPGSSTLECLALRGLVEGTSIQGVHPAAARLTLVEGAASLFPVEGRTNRQAFLLAGVAAVKDNTPAPLARSVLARLADLGATTSALGEADRMQLQAALTIANAVPSDERAVQILRAAFEGLAAVQRV